MARRAVTGGATPAAERGARALPDAQILKRIAALRPALSPAEARVAEAVLAAPAWVLENTLSAVAARARVSEPTVIRFCRSLGLDGYQTFRLRLARSLGSGGAFLHRDISRGDSAADLAAKIFERAARTLRDVSGQLAPGRLEAAISLLAAARRIEFYGLGSSGIVAADARHKFFRLGLQAAAYSDAHVHGMAATMLAPGDVAVAISSTGRTIDLIASVELAREAGADVIAIAPPGSPLAQRCSLPLEIAVDEDTDVYTPMTTRLAQLTLIDVLSIGVALRLGPELAARLERARDSLRGKRLNEAE
ncbi:MAG TPA: SIS domain-containing protein [Steroidobacteraceae bacterium]|nr:SIS domain-containing protein [Steroidobacteraceae bacterium]